MAARGDLIALPGRLIFSDLAEPVLVTGAKVARYSVKIGMSKESPVLKDLWALISTVGKRVWGREAKEKLENLKHCIDSGLEAKKSDISIQDGDLFQPEYNEGTYMLQATRRKDKGAPEVYDAEGNLIADVDQYPEQGDGVIVLVNVWAQADYGRMNFTLEAVRKVIQGVRTGGPSREEITAAVAEMNRLTLSSIAGVTPAGAQIEATAGKPRKAKKGEEDEGTDVPVESSRGVRRVEAEVVDEDEDEDEDLGFDFDEDDDFEDEDGPSFDAPPPPKAKAGKAAKAGKVAKDRGLVEL